MLALGSTARKGSARKGSVRKSLVWLSHLGVCIHVLCAHGRHELGVRDAGGQAVADGGLKPQHGCPLDVNGAPEGGREGMKAGEGLIRGSARKMGRGRGREGRQVWIDVAEPSRE
jgi:hypothetical protein